MDPISKIYNANIYLDGTINLVGRASQIVLPNITAVTEEHKALGMPGSVEFLMGLAKLEAKIKWEGFYAEYIATSDFMTAHKLQVRANVQTFGPGGLEEEKPLVVKMTGTFKDKPLGTFAPQTSVNFEDAIALTYIEQSLDGKELLAYDPVRAIWRVNGKDMLAKYRANLGI